MRTRLEAAERGTAAVEFALVLPLVLTVALALVQTGLLLRDRLLVEAAARAAAVQEDESAIRAAALTAAPSLDDAAVSLTVERRGARGEPVTVSLGYTSSVRVPFVGWLFGPSVAMATSTTARQEFG
jgi:hypothetical protein